MRKAKCRSKEEKRGRGNEVREDGREEGNWPVVAYSEAHNV